MKTIYSRKMQEILVSDEDYDYLNQFKWSLEGGYAKRTEAGKRILMHREVMNFPESIIDHKDGNKANNTRDNLRTCTYAQNSYNKGKLKRNLSGYKGVMFDNRDKRWRAELKLKGIAVFREYYPCKASAALAYNEAALKYHGEFARLNVVTEELSKIPLKKNSPHPLRAIEIGETIFLGRKHMRWFKEFKASVNFDYTRVDDIKDGVRGSYVTRIK